LVRLYYSVPPHAIVYPLGAATIGIIPSLSQNIIDQAEQQVVFIYLVHSSVLLDTVDNPFDGEPDTFNSMPVIASGDNLPDWGDL